jgi:hypothetical protein
MGLIAWVRYLLFYKLDNNSEKQKIAISQTGLKVIYGWLLRALLWLS